METTPPAEPRRGSALALPLAAFLVLLNLGFDLGEIAVQRLGGSDSSLQSLPFRKSYYVLCRVLETNTVSGALRAQQLHLGGGQISHQAGYINLLLGCRHHLQHLKVREFAQADPGIRFGEDCFVSTEPALRGCYLLLLSNDYTTLVIQS